MVRRSIAAEVQHPVDATGVEHQAELLQGLAGVGPLQAVELLPLALRLVGRCARSRPVLLHLADGAGLKLLAMPQLACGRQVAGLCQ